MPFIESFTGGALDTDNWQIVKTGIAPAAPDPTVANRLEITMPTNDGNSRTVGIQTKRPFAFLGQQYELDIIQIPGTVSNIRGAVYIDNIPNSSQYVFVFIEQNLLFLYLYNGSPTPYSTAWSGTYEAIRLSHSAVDSKWRLSTRTSGVWTQRIETIASPWVPSYNRLRITGEHAGSFTPGNQFIVDSLVTTFDFWTARARVHNLFLPMPIHHPRYRSLPVTGLTGGGGNPPILEGQAFPTGFGI